MHKILFYLTKPALILDCSVKEYNRDIKHFVSEGSSTKHNIAQAVTLHLHIRKSILFVFQNFKHLEYFSRVGTMGRGRLRTVV